MRLTFTCQNCRRETTKPYSVSVRTASTVKYCSRECGVKARAQPPQERACARCGSNFTPGMGGRRGRAAKYCGLRCAGKRHGGVGSPEYGVWLGMRSRCSNPKSVGYSRYGARGIKVCQEWEESFGAFLADMGPRPSERHSIERKDNNRGYSPDNCVWATPEEQARNTSANHYVEANGERLVIQDWAARLGADATVIHARLASGWSEERAVLSPVRKCRHVNGCRHAARVRKGPYNPSHCPRGHERTPENLYVYRDGSHACRLCQKERNRQLQQRRVALRKAAREVR